MPQKVCAQCKGSGNIEESFFQKPCDMCEGKGVVQGK